MPDVDTLIKIASFLMSVGAIFYAWFATRRKDVDKRLKEGSDKMDGHELRIQALEQVTSQLPDKDQHHELRLTLAEMAGDMKAMRATMRGMSESMTRTESIVGRHEDHLRENH